MVFAYFKEGTDNKILEKQIEKVKFFAKLNGIEIDCYLKGDGEHICWSSDNLKETSLMKRIGIEDTIIVPEAVSFGNGFSQVTTVLAKVLKSRAHLFCINEGYSYVNEQANLEKAEAFLNAGEIEKEIKRESSKRGIALMRKSGRTIGHPLGKGRVNDMPKENMDLLLNSDISQRDEIIKKLGISKTSYYTYRRKYRTEKDNNED